jgi:hypothetical protein
MRKIVSILIGLFVILMSSQLFAGVVDHANVSGAKVALEGYDPVAYHLNKPGKGSEQISLVHENIVYHFVNEENKISFKKDPEKYTPAYGGWCAWAMLNGEKVKVDPLRYKIIDGKNYLYYNSFFTDTLEKWDDLAERESEQALVKRADNHWSTIISGE